MSVKETRIKVLCPLITCLLPYKSRADDELLHWGVNICSQIRPTQNNRSPPSLSYTPLPHQSALPPFRSQQADTCSTQLMECPREEREGVAEMHVPSHGPCFIVGGEKLSCCFSVTEQQKCCPSPSCKHSCVQAQMQTDRETTCVTWAESLSLSLSLSVLSVSFSLTQCSLRHKGRYGNTAFRSPVALFMQRCITMGPPTDWPCRKARRSPVTLCLSHSTSPSLSQDHLPPQQPHPPLHDHQPTTEKQGGIKRGWVKCHDREEMEWTDTHGIHQVLPPIPQDK